MSRFPRRTRTVVAFAALVSLLLTIISVVRHPRTASFAVLSAFGIGLSTALGALMLLVIFHLAHATWFVALRRLAEALAATLPLFVVLFVPVLIFAPLVYPWAASAPPLDAEAQHALAARGVWFHRPFFVGRAALYFVTWITVAGLLRRATAGRGVEHETPAASEARVRRQRMIAGAALPPIALTVTFAAFDWFMSVDATWASDLYGVYFFAGGVSAAVGTLAVVAWIAKRVGAFPTDVGPPHFHALGRILLAVVMLWGYLAFCQFLLVWIADLPREVGYYQDRVKGTYGGLTVALAVFHIVPFFLLLSREAKRRPGVLALVGGGVVIGHCVDVAWLVLPARRTGLDWFDAAPVAFVLVAMASLGAWSFLGADPLPTGDPHLRRSLRYRSL